MIFSIRMTRPVSFFLRVPIVLELYRRKWQGGNIHILFLSTQAIQLLACKAPVFWSKYTTQTRPVWTIFKITLKTGFETGLVKQGFEKWVLEI